MIQENSSMGLGNIKLIIWDLDETLWEGIISESKVVVRENLAGFIRDTTDMGIVHSICSKNDFGQVKKQLESIGLWDYFVFPSIDWSPKGARIKEIISEMGLRETNVLFIDDNVQNLNEAKFYCEGIKAMLPDGLEELCEEAAHGDKTDAEHKRLDQYRILEKKKKSKEKFEDNTEFLMSCNIQVDICADCLSQIDRIHELLMRSNQLNYTKFRQPKEELRSLIQEEGVKSGYVKVHDNFGDYGIVGFFAVKEGKAVHFLFSCRTLGMLVEQYTYMMAGCPELDVVGDVATQLNKDYMPAWINQKGNASVQMGSSELSSEILFKGPCDLMQMFTFIKKGKNIVTEFTYVNDAGISIEGINHTAQLATSLELNSEQKKEIISEFSFFDKDMFSTAIGSTAFDIVVYSLIADANLGLYRNKSNGAMVAMCEKAYDLTKEENWGKYIRGEVYTSNIRFTEEELIRFAAKYEFISDDDGSRTVDNLDRILPHVKARKLIFILGTEREYPGNVPLNYIDRHKVHKMMNDKIRKWASDKPNVILLPLDHVILSDADFVDSINHFTKSASYRLAGELTELIRDENLADLKMAGKGQLLYQVMRQKMRILKKNVLK